MHLTKSFILTFENYSLRRSSQMLENFTAFNSNDIKN